MKEEAIPKLDFNDNEEFAVLRDLFDNMEFLLLAMSVTRSPRPVRGIRFREKVQHVETPNLWPIPGRRATSTNGSSRTKWTAATSYTALSRALPFYREQSCLSLDGTIVSIYRFRFDSKLFKIHSKNAQNPEIAKTRERELECSLKTRNIR